MFILFFFIIVVIQVSCDDHVRLLEGFHSDKSSEAFLRVLGADLDGVSM